jgi:hypothetical protein
MNKTLKGCAGCLGILIACILALFVGLYVYYEWIWEEWPTERIERITGVKVPEFDVIERHESIRHIPGDYLDILTIEFESLPSDDLFDEIDKIIASSNTSWRKEGNKYHFSVMWGNGYPTPKGEREEADGIFHITLTKGEKKGEIRCGAW